LTVVVRNPGNGGGGSYVLQSGAMIVRLAHLAGAVTSLAGDDRHISSPTGYGDAVLIRVELDPVELDRARLGRARVVRRDDGSGRPRMAPALGRLR